MTKVITTRRQKLCRKNKSRMVLGRIALARESALDDFEGRQDQQHRDSRIYRVSFVEISCIGSIKTGLTAHLYGSSFKILLVYVIFFFSSTKSNGGYAEVNVA